MNKRLQILLIVILIVVVAIISYFVGYKKAYDDYKYTLSQNGNELEFQNFYAEIKEINGKNITVKGLDINDINYRGEFTFQIYGETKIEWRNTDITFSDLDVGDKISITFTGSVRETYPAQLPEVIKIQLLDDEK